MTVAVAVTRLPAATDEMDWPPEVSDKDVVVATLPAFIVTGIRIDETIEPEVPAMTTLLVDGGAVFDAVSCSVALPPTVVYKNEAVTPEGKLLAV